MIEAAISAQIDCSGNNLNKSLKLISDLIRAIYQSFGFPQIQIPQSSAQKIATRNFLSRIVSFFYD